MSLSRRDFVKTVGIGTAGALTSSFISARGREALVWGAEPLQSGSGDIIIASNENPVGPGKIVLKAMDDAIGSDGAALGRYPFGMTGPMTEAIATGTAMEGAEIELKQTRGDPSACAELVIEEIELFEQDS